MMMKKCGIVVGAVLGLFVLAGALASAAEKDSAPRKAHKAVVQANTEFALDLFQKLRTEKGNLFICPHSISTAMTMVLAGARGSTEKEIAAALKQDIKGDALNKAFHELETKLNEACGKDNQLMTANALCLTDGDVSAEYKGLLREFYNAEVFKGELAQINQWVSKKTQGKIKEILKKLHRNSVCVLLNAVYFKGVWAVEFDKKKTHDSKFTLATGKKNKVRMMYIKSSFRQCSRKNCSVIEIPYKEKNLSMLVLLPDSHDSLDKLEKSLDLTMIQDVFSNLKKARQGKVNLFLPRFKIKSHLMDLVPALKSLGIKDAFQLGKADFEGMGWPKGKLAINQVKHRAVVEVNEQGTEAAGATAVEMFKRDAKPKTPVFRADHPFLFLIREKSTGAVLFLGRFTGQGSLMR